jgi:hypothetical protein
MKTKQFALIAIENTQHWNLPDDSTLLDTRKFTLGIFSPGEATYCCSLTPATYVDDLENIFINPDGSPLTDEQISELDRTGLQYEALDHGYHGFVRDPENNPLVGDILEIELDPDDYEDEDALDRALWDEAREEFSSNGAAWEPPLTGIVPEPA